MMRLFTLDGCGDYRQVWCVAFFSKTSILVVSDKVRPTKEQHPLFPEKWEGTIDRAQFLKKARQRVRC